MSGKHEAQAETALTSTAITPEVLRDARAIAEWQYPGQVAERLADEEWLLTVAAATNAGWRRARDAFNEAVAFGLNGGRSGADR